MYYLHYLIETPIGCLTAAEKVILQNRINLQSQIMTMVVLKITLSIRKALYKKELLFD